MHLFLLKPLIVLYLNFYLKISDCTIFFKLAELFLSCCVYFFSGSSLLKLFCYTFVDWLL